MIPVRLLAPAAAVALAAAGCGSSSSTSSNTSTANVDPAGTAPAKTSTAAPAPKAGTGQAPAVANAKDTKHRPKIAKPSGDPPTSLVKKDLVVGTGPAIKSGQTATVQYEGISWSTGQEFDASWNRPGEPFSFPVGQQQVIPGWDQGIPGMRVGGRRELVIPPDLAYGPGGSGPIGPNETLVFVVDLVKIG